MTENYITITWSVDDVLDRAKENNIDITEQQAEEILQNMKSQRIRVYRY